MSHPFSRSAKLFACLAAYLLGAVASTSHAETFVSFNGRDTVLWNGIVYFAADNETDGYELWRSDGTDDGTFELADISVGAGSSYPHGFALAANAIYFSADDGVHNQELWTTDGSPSGTRMVKDIAPGADASNPFFIQSISDPIAGNLILFQASDRSGSELWRSDGTEAGTTLVKDLNPGPAASYPIELVRFGGSAYFSADDGIHGRELWVSNGSPDDTRLVADLQLGLVGSFPARLAVIDQHLVFAANDGVRGTELWAVDGATGSMTLLKDINPGSAPSLPDGFFRFGTSLYFAADSALYGRELWKTDGTAGGTALVADVTPGVGSSNPNPLMKYQGRLLFAAYDTSDAPTLWLTDGTAAGTFQMGQDGGVSSTIGWQAPTLDADGQPLTNLAGFRIYFGATPDALVNSVEIVDPDATTFRLDYLPAGATYFAVTAFTSDQTESDLSEIVSNSQN